MPTILNGILATVLILIAGTDQINPVTMAPTSIAFIIGLMPDHEWFGFLQNVSLMTLWTIYLTYVGVNRWTDLGSKKSYLIAVLPYAIIGGIWAIILIV